MKITSVRSFLLSYPFPEPVRLPFYGGERTLLKRDAMFIRVEADNGLVGYAPGPGSESVHRAIGETIAPFLEGRVLADPDALRVHFLQGPGADASTRQDLLRGGDRALRSGRQGARRSGVGTAGRAGARQHPPVWQRRHVHVAGGLRRRSVGDRRAGIPRLQDAAGGGPGAGPGDRAPDAPGGGPRFRPDGGRAHLVAHGRPQLLAWPPWNNWRRTWPRTTSRGWKSRCRPTTTPPTSRSRRRTWCRWPPASTSRTKNAIST